MKGIFLLLRNVFHSASSDPTRGDDGTQSKYILQISAKLPLLAGAPSAAYAIIRISIGDAVYLRISGAYSKVLRKLLLYVIVL